MTNFGTIHGEVLPIFIWLPNQINQEGIVSIVRCLQGRIYVANEYSTFTKTMSMVGQKLTFSRQITLNVRQNMSVLVKNMQILG